ncbi:hypothetical protein [Mesorhizobium sp. L-8-10]|uniref:hypothetical protein n=1 Tax=Mesorhizobium sp. L-8-10 TaxID=2744523 RepID=UPI001928D45A|nr:hypothetical protein [Mesorhizobium sp. L-8-10]
MTQKLVVIGAKLASGRLIEHLFETAPGVFDPTFFSTEGPDIGARQDQRRVQITQSPRVSGS